MISRTFCHLFAYQTTFAVSVPLVQTHMRGFSFRGSQAVTSGELRTRVTCLLLLPSCFTEPVTKDPKSPTKSRKTPSHVFPLPKGTWLSPLDPGRTMKHSELIVLFMFFIKAAWSAELLQLHTGTVLLTCYHWNHQLLWQWSPLDLPQDPGDDDYINTADLQIYGNLWETWSDSSIICSGH